MKSLRKSSLIIMALVLMCMAGIAYENDNVSLAKKKMVTIFYPDFGGVGLTVGSKMSPEVYKNDPKVKGIKVKYSSQNKSIAKVNKKGTIYGVSPGNTIVIAKTTYTYKGKKKKQTDQIKVCVMEDPDAGIKPAGLYAADGTRVFTWQELIDRKRIEVDGTKIDKGSDTLEGSLYLPKGYEEIDDNAFIGCKELKYIFVPSDIKKIGSSAFKDCASLEEIRLSPNITEIGWGAFENCKSLSGIKWPQMCTEIPNNLFAGCESIRKFDISEGVTYFAAGAFMDCSNIESISIPSTVTKIEGSFTGCFSLKSISVDKNNLIYDSRDSCNAIIETDHNSLLAACSTTVIPKTVKKLVSRSFSGVKMKEVVIPGNVEVVERLCFVNADIESIIVEAGVGCLEKDAIRAYDDTPSLQIKRVYIHSGVKKMEESSVMPDEVYVECTEDKQSDLWGGYSPWFGYRNRTIHWGVSFEEYKALNA